MRKDNIAVRREHEAIRNSVGFYDFTHKLLEVKGADARDSLDRMFFDPKGNRGRGVYS